MHLWKTSQKYCACHAKRLLTRHETCWDVTKAPRLPRKTTLQPVLKSSSRGGFAASPIDTATPQENQRLETRHVGASKRAFCARLPCTSQFAASKSTFSHEFSYEPTSKSTFRTRLPSIFITCHRNSTPATEFAPCHHFAQSWQWDVQKYARRHV